MGVLPAAALPVRVQSASVAVPPLFRPPPGRHRRAVTTDTPPAWPPTARYR